MSIIMLKNILTFKADAVFTAALAAVMLLLGYWVKGKSPTLRKYCIPAPVVGGLIFAIAHCILRSAGIVEFNMDDTLQKIEIILKERGLQLRADADQLADVQKKLATADVQRQKLEAEAAQAVEQLNAATVAANIALEKRKGLQNQTSYASKADAEQELAESLSILQAAEHDDKRTEQDLSSARTQADQCQATIVQLRDVQLPAQRQTTGTRKEAYEAACRDKAMDEAKWKSVVEQHRKNEVRTLQEAIEQYQSQRGKYEGMKATAVETIAGREKPHVGILQNTMAAAEEQLKSADTAYSRCQQMCMVDERIYEALSPKMAQHIDLARQFAEIDGLYRRLSGNQSGAHMDIETFVQRQYLQSILNAANQRFRQMSSNEFELRMIDDEHAGEGRTNQGLDLMVYSYATSETRRVETLSGGETFMAALSLALGMADQIQATSGSIHLDMMFIDEGFGSLDDHSRDNAIDVLKKMASRSRISSSLPVTSIPVPMQGGSSADLLTGRRCRCYDVTVCTTEKIKIRHRSER